MLNYTNALTELIRDIVTRVDGLSFIDPARVLVFARVGRSGAAGAYATCHCLNLPTTEPGYYFWRDRQSGAITRRTECFVTRTPEVWIDGARLDYMISFAIPRFCDQPLRGLRKAHYYKGYAPWVSKLDTVVHELYHISPQTVGLRKFECLDGTASTRSHGPLFLEEVAALVRAYLKTKPDPRFLDFLAHDANGLRKRFGGILGATFRNYPSYPQRFLEVVETQPDLPPTAIVPVARSSQPLRYTEHDLDLRLFTRTGTRRVRLSELEEAA